MCTPFFYLSFFCLDCKTSVFFLKISKEISKTWRRSLFSASFQTFCLTARAYLNTQKYGLFCSLSFVLNSPIFQHEKFQSINVHLYLKISPSKRIRIPESKKILLLESVILGFGIRNMGQIIRNPTNNCNPESKDWNPLNSIL